jgi:hypothetical protein
MKTSIVLFSIFALGVFALGTGVRPAAGKAPALTVAAAMPYQAPEFAVVRRVALPVLPTVTVVPSAQDLADAYGTDLEQRSVMLDAAVGKATRALEVASPALPRVSLGNPFYDFGHRPATSTATE